MNEYTIKLMQELSGHIGYFKRMIKNIDVYLEKNKDIVFKPILLIRLDLLFLYILFCLKRKKLKQTRSALQEIINLSQKVKNENRKTETTQ